MLTTMIASSLLGMPASLPPRMPTGPIMLALADGVQLWVMLAVASIPLFILLGKVIFGSWSEFGETLGYALKPDLLSWFDGEWSSDMVAELKLGIFIMICAGLVWGEHWLLEQGGFIASPAAAAALAAEEDPDLAPRRSVVADTFEMRRGTAVLGRWKLEKFHEFQSRGRLGADDQFRFTGTDEWQDLPTFAGLVGAP